MPNFADALQAMSDQAQPNVSVTENGAIGYKTTGHELLNLNFKLSSLRDRQDDEIMDAFALAFNENAVLSVAWLFFARDIRGGAGERRTFRVCFTWLAQENPELAARLLRFIPEYGRWDDLISLLEANVREEFKVSVRDLIFRQLIDDITNYDLDESVSLLAKWLPSANTSSAHTRALAMYIYKHLGVTEKEYRQMLSKLRQRIDVTERKMSANEWDKINYSGVPSKAALTYRHAFAMHDEERYMKYLEAVEHGEAKINASALFPYELVTAYNRKLWSVCPMDETIEAQWKALPDVIPDCDTSTLVVVDGSGSMTCRVGGNTNASALDVAWSLGLYFSERMQGPYANRFITFSANPRMVSFDGAKSLMARLQILREYDDCSNTNIEKTMNLILDTAVLNHFTQDQLPRNLLIVSDMEFDSCFWGHDMEPIFESIRRLWAYHGYKLPRLIFWNVMGRTDTIPVTTNELGVALVSGFSQNIARMVFSGRLDPWEILVETLTSDRYQPVFQEAMKNVRAVRP